MTIFFLR